MRRNYCIQNYDIIYSIKHIKIKVKAEKHYCDLERNKLLLGNISRALNCFNNYTLEFY